MSEKKRFVQSKYAHHLQDTKTDIHYYLTVEKIGCKELFDEIERLTEENEQLRKENVFLAKQRNYWKGKSDMAVETFEIDEATEKKISELEKENEQLKKRVYDFEKRKIIEESEIDDDIIPKIKLLRTELFGEK